MRGSAFTTSQRVLKTMASAAASNFWRGIGTSMRPAATSHKISARSAIAALTSSWSAMAVARASKAALSFFLAKSCSSATISAASSSSRVTRIDDEDFVASFVRPEGSRGEEIADLLDADHLALAAHLDDVDIGMDVAFDALA